MCDHCGCRAFPPIAELTAEHVDILARAWVLAEAEREGRAPSSEDVAALTALLDRHALKEETGLYPELIDCRASSADQIEDLEQEHRDLHEALTSGRFDRRDYFALAAHIEVEEMELFSAAMLSFDEEEWEAMQGAHHSADHPAPTSSTDPVR